ncbi:MAG: cyclomaltodextrinase N-terminal domain-containing protein, partial [Bacteroidota bacterium]
MKKITACVLIIFSFAASRAQTIAVYPTNWWVDMKNQKLQLMLHGTGIGNATGFTIGYPGVTMNKITKVKNKNYVFLDLTINASAKPGNVPVMVQGVPGVPLINYTLQARRTGKGTSFAQGVTSSDFIYFLMPDRFSNGDESNDRVAGMKDQSLNRDSI